jgi:hypothetical protein
MNLILLLLCDILSGVTSARKRKTEIMNLAAWRHILHASTISKGLPSTSGYFGWFRILFLRLNLNLKVLRPSSSCMINRMVNSNGKSWNNFALCGLACQTVVVIHIVIDNCSDKHSKIGIGCAQDSHDWQHYTGHHLKVTAHSKFEITTGKLPSSNFYF